MKYRNVLQFLNIRKINFKYRKIYIYICIYIELKYKIKKKLFYIFIEYLLCLLLCMKLYEIKFYLILALRLEDLRLSVKFC